jgi:hypothetical protein
VLACHRDHEVGFGQHLPGEGTTPVLAQINPQGPERVQGGLGRAMTARVAPGGVDVRFDAVLGEAARQEHLGGRRPTEVRGAQHEHVHAGSVRAARHSALRLE